MPTNVRVVWFLHYLSLPQPGAPSKREGGIGTGLIGEGLSHIQIKEGREGSDGPGGGVDSLGSG